MPALRDPQHERFASELAELKPTIEAYKLAGYVPHRGNAARLARRPEVRARVRELLEEAAEFANVRRVRVVVEVDRVGRANFKDFFRAELDAEGNRTGADVLIPLHELPRELSAAIKSFKYDDHGRPVLELHDRNQANFTLLKYLGGMPEADTPRQTVNIFNALSLDDQLALATLLEALTGGPANTGRTAAGERGAPSGAP